MLCSLFLRPSPAMNLTASQHPPEHRPRCSPCSTRCVKNGQTQGEMQAPRIRLQGRTQTLPSRPPYRSVHYNPRCSYRLSPASEAVIRWSSGCADPYLARIREQKLRVYIIDYQSVSDECDHRAAYRRRVTGTHRCPGWAGVGGFHTFSNSNFRHYNLWGYLNHIPIS
jgi:hypothetical protein